MRAMSQKLTSEDMESSLKDSDPATPNPINNLPTEKFKFENELTRLMDLSKTNQINSSKEREDFQNKLDNLTQEWHNLQNNYDNLLSVRSQLEKDLKRPADQLQSCHMTLTN